ncbi:tryptophan halogenase family protein [Croceicoccus marinus]|uniref:Tryptophan halogenase n=1 Tax=Croceicoccus marinus TaxID=450378 RepID=A0A1Z1FB33_9SPHN|nr:tryptophan halogenase family protein [Croceicoccus marinus]ARU16019.1 tryptophan halogenase [Croceicoccus marinus]
MSARKVIVTNNRIDRIVVVGGGTAGWMAAAAFSRYFDNGRRKIIVVESDAIGTVGVGEATIPAIKGFNAMLDIPENEFLRETRGTFKLGIEFVNWGRQGDRYIHPFGAFGTDLHGIPFHQLWLREHARGGGGDITDFSMSAAAAALGRFGRPAVGARPPVSEINYAFHFDATLYAAYLRRLAERQGAIRQEGRIVKVHRDGESGDVTSVELEGGRLVEGDLFLDCSGFRGLLIEDALETGYEDWSHWLPMDRAIAMPTANRSSPDPFTRATAHAAGWQWRIPLQHRTGNGHVFCSAFMQEDEAERILRDTVEGEELADPRLIRFTTGMRRKAWSHNVVSLGLSSGFIEPLESTSIHLVQNGIARLFGLFPEKDISPVERDEYNRGMREIYEDVRDFIILHYKATQRDDTEFWRSVRDMDIPASLARKMELWRLHGRVFRENAELFTLPSWVAVMLGQNVWPERYDPIADTLDENRVAQAMEKMRAGYRQTAQQLPPQEQFLRSANAWAVSDEMPLSMGVAR